MPKRISSNRRTAREVSVFFLFQTNFCWLLASLCTSFVVHHPHSDVTQRSHPSNQTAFIGGQNAGLARDAIEIMISLRWLYLLSIGRGTEFMGRAGNSTGARWSKNHYRMTSVDYWKVGRAKEQEFEAFTQGHWKWGVQCFNLRVFQQVSIDGEESHFLIWRIIHTFLFLLGSLIVPIIFAINTRSNPGSQSRTTTITQALCLLIPQHDVGSSGNA